LSEAQALSHCQPMHTVVMNVCVCKHLALTTFVCLFAVCLFVCLLLDVAFRAAKWPPSSWRCSSSRQQKAQGVSCELDTWLHSPSPMLSLFTIALHETQLMAPYTAARHDWYHIVHHA
jgi:hypothetical protein